MQRIESYWLSIRPLSISAVCCSRVESVSASPSYDAVAASQDTDNELRTLLASTTALLLEKQQIPSTTVFIYVCRESSAVRSSSLTAASVLVRPRSVAPRHQSSSEVGRTMFREAKHTEGLPKIGTSLPVLSALQSLPSHSYNCGRLHTADTQNTELWRYLRAAPIRSFRWEIKCCSSLCIASTSPCLPTGSSQPPYWTRPTARILLSTPRPAQIQPQHHRPFCYRRQLSRLDTPVVTSTSSPKQLSRRGEGGDMGTFHKTVLL
jgi:hypothetical protein